MTQFSFSGFAGQAYVRELYNSDVIVFMMVGSYTGSYVPVVFSRSVLSLASVLLGAVGGGFGIYIGYKLAQLWGLE